MLVRARGTDFNTATTDAVAMGTRVKLTELDTQNQDIFTILGAWDSLPEKGIISYMSPLAQSLIGHKVGDEVECDLEGGHKKVRIDTIELALATPQPAPPSAESQPAATTASSGEPPQASEAPAAPPEPPPAASSDPAPAPAGQA
jgi:hypothetical protein